MTSVKNASWLSDSVPGRPCAIIGEVAQAHDGSLGFAHAFIDAVADTSCDAVKFQTHIAAAESTLAEPWRVKFSSQDATRYDYWRRMEFSESQWAELKAHAEAKGLVFLSSAFSMEAVELLHRIGMNAWKIASGETGNLPMLRRIASFRQPVILSTGMSGWREVDEAVALLRASQAPFAVLQCTSSYPCPPEVVGLNVIPELRTRYGSSVGFSDHSGKIYAGLAAATLGIEVLEVHITLSRRMFGPDVAASLTVEELTSLVEGVRFIEAAKAAPVDKEKVARSKDHMRALFTKSVVAVRDLPAGTVLTEANITLKKPGGGLPPSRFESLIGHKLRQAVTHDQQLREDDLG
jgi:N,N'-diacetyllegionaminate synthase